MAVAVDRRHHDGCECVRCVGFTPGHELSVRHGAFSERRVAPAAAAVLERIGLAAEDVDPIGHAYLEMFARAAGKLVLLDDYLDEHGLIREDGSVQPALSVYASIANAASRALVRLEDHLRVAERDPAAVLAELREPS